MPEEECKEQSADVRAIHIGIGCNNNFMIAQFREVKGIADSGAERNDEVLNFLKGKNLIQTRPFNIQNFPLQGEHCLGTTVPALLARAAGRIPLHNKELRLLRTLGLAVGELAWERHSLKRAFAQDAVFGGFSGFARFHGKRNLANNHPRVVRLLLHKIAKGIAED